MKNCTIWLEERRRLCTFNKKGRMASYQRKESSWWFRLLSQKILIIFPNWTKDKNKQKEDTKNSKQDKNSESKEQDIIESSSSAQFYKSEVKEESPN